MKLTLKAAALGAAITLTLAGAVHAQEITLKVSHFWAPGAMAPTKVIGPWCDKINKESGGKLKCQIFPAMQLGGTPAQAFDQVKDGVADIAYTLPGYTAGRFPLMEVFELPFMNSNAEASSQAVWDYYLTTPAVQKEFAGVKPLMFHTHDEGYVHTKDKQIKTLADFKGLKMRAPTRQTNKLLSKLGAAPVPMPLPAIPDAISKGVIDGFLLPWEVIPSVKLHEMVKFHSETDPKERALYSAIFIMAMNPAKYDSLPADLKKVPCEPTECSVSRIIRYDSHSRILRTIVKNTGKKLKNGKMLSELCGQYLTSSEWSIMRRSTRRLFMAQRSIFRYEM